MGRPSRFKVAALAELFEQLRFAPAETRRRQMDAAEQLVAEIDPQRNYPDEFIAFRITGYRSDRADDPVTLVGEALLPDLVTFVKRLSGTLDLPADYDGRSASPLDDVADRLDVSIKTLHRYRKQGLVCHEVVYDDGRRKLSCFNDALARYIESNKKRIEAAGEFSRIDADGERRMIQRAEQLRREEGLSLNSAAEHIASETNRAQETIRSLLQRNEKVSAEPIFDERGPLTDEEQEHIERAYRRGESTGELSEQFGRSRKTILRVVRERRAVRLRSFDLSHVRFPTFDLDEADEVLLSPPTVKNDLNAKSPETLASLLMADTAVEAIDESEQLALIAAQSYLKHRAENAIRDITDAPAEHELDRIETDLRWVSLLIRKLVMCMTVSARKTLERNLHRPLSELPSDELLAQFQLAISVVNRVVQSLDPTRGQRLESKTTQELDRALAARSETIATDRAAARHDFDQIAIDDPYDSLCPWDAWLTPKHVGRMSKDDRELVDLRYGRSGGPPRTCRELATMYDTTPGAIKKRLRRGSYG